MPVHSSVIGRPLQPFCPGGLTRNTQHPIIDGMRSVLRQGLFLAMSMVLLVACGSEATSMPTASPTPTPTPTPVFSPTPEERLKVAADRMSALTSLRFTMTHEQGRTPLMTGVELQKVEGLVALPNRASMDVEAVVTVFGSLVTLHVVVDGDQASMTDPLTGVPQDLSADSLPFNFLNLGVNLGHIVRALGGPTYTTNQEIDGVLSYGIAGSVLAGDLSRLVRAASGDVQVGLELWVGDDDLIRRLRIEGPLVSRDAPGVVRILTLESFDQPATITPLS